jgi:hypothetical protein
MGEPLRSARAHHQGVCTEGSRQRARAAVYPRALLPDDRGRSQKTIETYQLWTQTYPKDFVPHSNLAGMYSGRNEYEKAVEGVSDRDRAGARRAAAILEPCRDLPDTEQADDARRLLEEAIPRGVDFGGVSSGAL